MNIKLFSVFVIGSFVFAKSEQPTCGAQYNCESWWRGVGQISWGCINLSSGSCGDTSTWSAQNCCSGGQAFGTLQEYVDRCNNVAGDGFCVPSVYTVSDTPTASPTASPTIPITCHAKVLNVVDKTYQKNWEQQYSRSYDILNHMVNEYDTNIALNGVQIGITEIDDTINPEHLVMVESSEATDKSFILSLIDTKKNQQNGKKSSETEFSLLANAIAPLSSDIIDSYIVLFSDGVERRKREIRQIKNTVNEAKQNLDSSKIVPKILCVQTWRHVTNDKLFHEICDKKFVVDMQGQTSQDLAQQIVDYTCSDKPVDPCLETIRKAGRCRKVKRNPTNGLVGLSPQVRMCDWNKQDKTCTLKTEYTSLFN